MAIGGGENKRRHERMVSSARAVGNLNTVTTGNQRYPYRRHHHHGSSGTALNETEDHEMVQARRYNRTGRR